MPDSTTTTDPTIASDAGVRETAWTPGPYQRVNATVYALTESGGWRNGKPDMCNRFTAFVQSGARCRSGEEEATAQLFAAAPDLFEALEHPLLRQLLGEIEDSGTPEAARLWGLAMAWFDVRDAAIARATQQGADDAGRSGGGA